MSQSQSLGTTQVQKQVLTQKQIQFFQILQIPTLELENRIDEELEMNPALEEDLDAEIVPELEKKEEISNELEQVKEDDDGDFSLDEFVNDEVEGYKSNKSPDDEDYEFPIPSQMSFSENLIDQLHYQNLSDEELLLAEEIIGNIDEDGFLRRDLNDVLGDLGQNISLTLEQSEKVLQSIQRLNPPGIGARNVQECLLVQLELLNDVDEKLKSLAFKILTEFFKEYINHNYDKLIKNLQITNEDLEKVNEIIIKLNPKPGEGQVILGNDYILPDFLVRNIDDELEISLNYRNIPPLRINKTYLDMIKRKKENKIDSETKKFIKGKIESAKFFLENIYLRQNTMLKVMTEIVNRQKEFFLEGPEFLKPLIYKDIAEVTKLDISTISRVVNKKYVQTDFGTYKLKYFFGEEMTMTDGQVVQNKQIKSKIKDIIKSENKSDPFTDDNLVDELIKSGFKISRRTVTKYREEMGIPIARWRKEI